MSPIPQLQIGFRFGVLVSFGALPADTIIPAATRILLPNFLLDTQPAFRIMGDGKMEWGPGGTTAPDINLYRSGAGQIQSSGAFYATQIGAQAATANEILLASNGIQYFHSSHDTYLQRTGAGALYTNGTFQAAGRFFSGAPGTGGMWVDEGLFISSYSICRFI